MTVPGAFFQLLRLASPGLPVGGYSYSQGLESALDAGLVGDPASAEAWLADVMAGPLARHDAPLAGRAWERHDDCSELARLNAIMLASRETAAQQRELLQMGYSLRTLLESLPEGRGVTWPGTLAAGVTYPVAWALAARAFGLERGQTIAAFLFCWLENQVLVLMKALPLGHTAGQQLLSALLPRLGAAASVAAELDEAEWSNFAPLLSWAALRHQTQYTRLFRT